MFDAIFEAIEEWMRTLLTTMVTSNLQTMFTDVNEKTGEIATQVGQTPQGWNGSIFGMIQNLSSTVILPIAGMIITAAEKSHNVPFPFCFAQNKRSSRIDSGKPLPNGSIFNCCLSACLLFSGEIPGQAVCISYRCRLPSAASFRLSVGGRLYRAPASFSQSDRSLYLYPAPPAD